jgi:hypothetical protein
VTPCERIVRNAYANPHLHGDRARIARWERSWWTRSARLPRWTARRQFLMANADWLGMSVKRAAEVLPMPVWGAR